MNVGARFVLCAVVALVCAAGCSRDRCCGPDDGGAWPEPGQTLDVWTNWCPADTNKIGYTHYPKTYEELLEYGNHSVWTVDVATGEREYIARGWLVDWFPDGKRVLICREDGGLSIRDLGTGEEEAIPIFTMFADVSPSGRSIAYGGPGEHGLWVMNLDSLTSRWVTDKWVCDWSPDGQELLCDSLVIVRADGSRVGKIPCDTTSGLPSWARWSPDGKSVAFSAGPASGHPAVSVINVDGTGQVVVADPGAGPSWCPNGKMIAFSAVTAENTTAIWVANWDGTGRRQATFP